MTIAVAVHFDGPGPLVMAQRVGREVWRSATSAIIIDSGTSARSVRRWITSTDSGPSSPTVSRALVIRSSMAMTDSLDAPDRARDAGEVGTAGSLGPPLDLVETTPVHARDTLDRFAPERQ